MGKTIKYILLFPFSLLFGLISQTRNLLFDKNLLKQTRFNIPIICVGNLTVGGTGKTPHTEYILSFLQNNWKTAMLSRGYKRKTKGFQLANKESDAETIGDEPFQIYRKFPKVIVAADEKRVHGIEELLTLSPDLEAVVLDDAFQHRHIQAGLYILLTDYSRLYTRDFYLPSGRLRESKKGSKRTDLIIVTKCPSNLSKAEMNAIQMEINPQKNQTLFFSTYEYDDLKPCFPNFEQNRVKKLSENSGILLMAGIVSTQPIIDYLQQYTTHIETLFFPDHHHFTERDIHSLYKKFNLIDIEDKIIVVTEKDAARLLSINYYPNELKSKTFTLPIQVKILNDKESLLTEKIQSYVKENTRNS